MINKYIIYSELDYSKPYVNIDKQMSKKERDYLKALAIQYKLKNGAVWVFVSCYFNKTILININ